jgi:hypothetical protein
LSNEIFDNFCLNSFSPRKSSGSGVTMVKDATADYSDEMMHALLDINIPNYASAVVTAAEVVGALALAPH